MKHRVLKRQLAAHGLTPDSLPQSLAEWRLFLERVEKAYTDADSERYLMERSMSISSKEMQERWRQVEIERTKSLQAEKLAVIGMMSAGVAHEINNPLAVISMLVGQMGEIFEEEPLDKALIRDMLKKVESTAGRISKIVNGLKMVSRESENDPFSTVSLRALVEETLMFCEGTIKQAQVELIREDVNSEFYVDCRPAQIGQVLLNLLNNAVDAIGGFEKKWIRVSVRERENFLDVLVTDCGNGIPPEIQKKLFYPFFTTKEVGKGTGLGLSLSKKIMEAHGGDLTFDPSSPHTCFVITLPRTQAAPSTTAA